MKAKQGADAEGIDTMRSKAEALVWTDRMVSALVNGVTGGRWFSLIDKVWAPATLALGWTKVQANKGAAGVDGQSLERFAARSEKYLSELSAGLKDGSYRPQPVRGLRLPKAMEERDRWASRRSRTGLSRRR